IGMRPDVQPSVAQHLQDVAVQRSTGERLAPGQLQMQPRDVPREPLALVPPPFLQPQLGRGRIEAGGHGVTLGPRPDGGNKSRNSAVFGSGAGVWVDWTAGARRRLSVPALAAG